MASALVDVVVEKLGGMLIEEINKEISLFCNFRNDFEWLKKKLTSIRGYLRDADAQSAHSEPVRSWLLDDAELAWDAEDIVDECALQFKGTHNEIPQSSCVACVNFNYSQIAFRYKMARRLRDVKERMRSIMADAAELKLVGDLIHRDQLPSASTSRGNVKWRGASLIQSGARPVAIDSKVQEVVHLLDDTAASSIIAVVGMGGAGKTFLMQNVFSRLKDKFEKSAWLTVSQTYSLRRLQADLASEIKDLNEVVDGKVSEVQAAKLIHDKLLASKSCLVVLDDVWRATGEDDLIYALGLPMGNNNNRTQCKVVMTTRSRFVCGDLDARVYEMQLLSEEESWELFCAHAFPDCPQNQPPKPFESIAREIERECGRLLLAVKLVGASLKGKRLSSDWQSKMRQLRALSHVEDPVMQILKLSYDSLPPHLKPCFAFLSFFAEDEEIHSEYLINLWAAEGHIPQGDEQLDIGWDYICHLHSLCLLERQPFYYSDVVFYRSKVDIRYKLHDLVLDLAMSISRESKCASSVEEALKRGPTKVLMAKKRIGDDDVDAMASDRAYCTSRLRTLSLSQNSGIHNIPTTLLSGARVVRILDLSNTAISSLPACVENLKLLRFLNLSWTNITEVPACVRSNKSLRFLDISRCSSLKELPNWIGELDCLQHLDVSGFEGSIPKGLSRVVSLRVLRSFVFRPSLPGYDGYKLSAEDDGFLKLEHLVNLVNLREVQIHIDHDAQLKSIEDGILASLVKMRILTLRKSVRYGHDSRPPLSEKMTAMKDLEVLSLANFALPDWICAFSNLMTLYLQGNNCAEYPPLETLPNLISLSLVHNANCKVLPKGFWKRRGFPQLCFLQIWFFDQLEELSETKMEEGAMPRLETLQVSWCSNLKRVPGGLELLKNLKECTFRETGVTHLFKKGGELCNKMKANNPNLIIGT